MNDVCLGILYNKKKLRNSHNVLPFNAILTDSESENESQFYCIRVDILLLCTPLHLVSAFGLNMCMYRISFSCWNSANFIIFVQLSADSAVSTWFNGWTVVCANFCVFFFLSSSHSLSLSRSRRTNVDNDTQILLRSLLRSFLFCCCIFTDSHT